MVSALLILASESAERSETPFFIVGGVFAAWAVILGVTGTKVPSFAGNRGAMTAIIGFTVVLAAAAMATAVYVLT